MRRKTAGTAIVVVCAALLSSASRSSLAYAWAQAPEPPAFSSRSDLVVLDALVTDRKGRYVPGLTEAAFSVEEDGVRQTVQFFREHDDPATVGLLIDGSGSMAGVAPGVIAAVGAFAETSNPDDEMFALVFGDRVYSALPSAHPFTGNAGALREALVRAFRPRGRTALYDALAAGFAYLAKGTRHRRALVVVSDGGDNTSAVSLDHVMGLAAASNTVIYTVGLVDPVAPDAAPRVLKRLAETSGGNAFRPSDVDEVARDLRTIARDIRNSYTIGYVPTNAALDGRLRRIRVTVEGVGQRGLRVRTRRGYVAK